MRADCAQAGSSDWPAAKALAIRLWDRKRRRLSILQVSCESEGDQPIIYPIGVHKGPSNEIMLIDKKSTLSRLSRIERRVRGIRKMIEEERYCIDVLQQIGAIKAALSKVEDAVLKDHSKTCVAAAIASGNEAEQQKKFNELVDLIARYKQG